LPAGDVFRARLILALEDGLSHREIERRLGASAPTVSLWNGRFEESGVAGFALYPASSADRSGSGM
jgi:transposase